MKKSYAMLTLLFVFFLVTMPAVAVSHEPINPVEAVFSTEIFLETKTMEGITLPDLKGGVVSPDPIYWVEELDERIAPVAYSIHPCLSERSNMDMTSFIIHCRWKEHPSFLGIA